MTRQKMKGKKVQNLNTVLQMTSDKYLPGHYRPRSKSLSFCGGRVKKMYLWYETEKNEGEIDTHRKAGFSAEPERCIRGVMCQETLLNDIANALSLEILNRPGTGFSGCCAARYLVRVWTDGFHFPICKHRRWVFLMHCHFRSPLFGAALSHPSSCAATTSNDSVFPNRSQYYRTLTRWWRLDKAVLTHERKSARSRSAQSLCGSQTAVLAHALRHRQSCCSGLAQWALTVQTYSNQASTSLFLSSEQCLACLKLQPQKQQPRKGCSGHRAKQQPKMHKWSSQSWKKPHHFPYQLKVFSPFDSNFYVQQRSSWTVTCL